MPMTPKRKNKMSFEINILVVGQKAPVSLPFDTELLLRNEIEHPDIGRYFAIMTIGLNKQATG